jgi:cysteine desulfuration protein SufE
MMLENIFADFELLDDWEDYRYVIELGRSLPPLPEAARTEANKVRSCASQVWLRIAFDSGGAGWPPRLSFEGDSDAGAGWPSI